MADLWTVRPCERNVEWPESSGWPDFWRRPHQSISKESVYGPFYFVFHHLRSFASPTDRQYRSLLRHSLSPSLLKRNGAGHVEFLPLFRLYFPSSCFMCRCNISAYILQLPVVRMSECLCRIESERCHYIQQEPFFFSLLFQKKKNYYYKLRRRLAQLISGACQGASFWIMGHLKRGSV